ncbi:hypothetical protein N0V93_005847 [Gnomoniopsis smithogilvyi]|uniref:Zinc finger PHD-type domain-containing protein n=1 Tax=Gnomoniopsis smithogilvyi TaxID=1191159 RepID=A0A9W9CX32_9PEZI|nr:hypothetical protein N0V93_005847 [Gnomoniopsis smithogilvyi]
MSAPPTTRASRSRYSSPAMGGAASAAGVRTEGSSRRRGADKDKDRGSNTATSSAARASSTERSRRFMENWIEPERVRMPSFQEHGLVRQGVLETMEPLGTIPKPAMIKKLTGIGREGSPTTSNSRGGKKKIILKRKNGTTVGNSAAAATGTASLALGVPELLSGTQSPTPSTVATPQPVTSPTPAPAPEHSSVSTVMQNSPPTPTAKTQHLETPELMPLSDAISELTPEPNLNPASQPAPSSPPNIWDKIHRDQLRPPISTSNPFLTDPIKESIEDNASQNLPGTPQSAHSSASTYDSVTDEYYKRGTSIPGRPLFNAPTRHAAGLEAAMSPSVIDAGEDAAASSAHTQHRIPQPPLGPWYTEAELTRIIQQKEVVKTAIDYGVAEAIKHRCYVDAYALRVAYDENQDDARFLLQTEAVYMQMATRESAGEWARTLQPYKTHGQRNQNALKYFVPEAESDKDFDFETHKPLQAPYLHLISIDMKEVRNPKRRRATPPAGNADDAQNYNHDESTVLLQVDNENLPQKAHAQPDEPEQPERVATPPRKRQKTQTQTRHTSHARTASISSAAGACSMDTVTRGKVTISPEPRSVRAGSSVSDVSSLSSARSITPVEEPEDNASQAAQPSGDGNQASMQEGEQGQSQVQGQLSGNLGLRAQVSGTDSAHTEQAAAPVQPITEPLIRRLPARKARNNLAPGVYMVLPPDSDAVSNNPNPTSHSHPHSSNNSNLANASHNPDTMSLGKSQHNSNQGSAPTNHVSSKTQQPSKRSQRGLPDYAPANKLDAADDKMMKRAAARKRTQDLTEEVRFTKPSFIRGEPTHTSPTPARPGSSSSELSSVPEVEELELELEPVAQQKGRVLGTRATRANKRGHDEMDEDITPFSEDFGIEADISTGGLSRAVTPRPQKKQKKEVRRFKQSPTKNKAGLSAAAGAVPTRAANRSSPAVNGAPSNQEDNDDFCSFCSGTGNLVCCDGCNKAFHYMDHEPVVDPNDDTAWFCWDCMVKRDPSLIGEYKGPFSALLTNLDKRHAKAFVLPKKVRDYFEGVRTGADGEYEEFVPPAKGKKRKETEEEKKGVFDSYQIVDKDNQPILCHACSRSAGFGSSKRDIIPCSLCGLWWHADCLDPPKPTPPNPKTFVCPCHANDLLHKIPAQLGPAHKFRKIKGAPDISYAFRRGNVNNGWIDVEDDASDDDVKSVKMGLRDPGSWGKKYTLKASGIRDDFIAKIGRPQKPRFQLELPAVDYEEGAEERYEAALSILAFSRKVRAEPGHAVMSGSAASTGISDENSMTISKQKIETAGNTELEAMQQQLKEMQERINSRLRIRNGQNEPQQGPSKTRRSTRGKSVAALKAAEQTVEASEERREEVGSVTAEDNGIWAEAEDARLPAKPAVEGPMAPDLETKEASVDEHKDNAGLPVVKNEVAADGAPAVPTYTSTNDVDEPAPPASSDKTVTEAEPAVVTIVKATVEKHVDQVVDAALTPPSDLPKDVDELPTYLPAIKPTSNGVETPETTVADQATSPVEAEAMEIDRFDLE